MTKETCIQIIEKTSTGKDFIKVIENLYPEEKDQVSLFHQKAEQLLLIEFWRLNGYDLNLSSDENRKSFQNFLNTSKSEAEKLWPLDKKLPIPIY